MNHFASPRFWYYYRNLRPEIRKIADKNFELLKGDPRYPSRHLKQIGKLWSVRVGKQYRAPDFDKKDAIVWFWIGTHADYDKLIK